MLRLGYGPHRLKFESWLGQEICLFSKMPRLVLEPIQPSVKCVNGFFPGDKQQRCEVNRSPTSSAKVENE